MCGTESSSVIGLMLDRSAGRGIMAWWILCADVALRLPCNCCWIWSMGRQGQTARNGKGEAMISTEEALFYRGENILYEFVFFLVLLCLTFCSALKNFWIFFNNVYSKTKKIRGTLYALTDFLALISTQKWADYLYSFRGQLCVSFSNTIRDKPIKGPEIRTRSKSATWYESKINMELAHCWHI